MNEALMYKFIILMYLITKTDKKINAVRYQ